MTAISTNCSGPRANSIGNYTNSEAMFLDTEHWGHLPHDPSSTVSRPKEVEETGAADPFPSENMLWWELAGELCEVSGWFAGGDLSPDDFAQCVIAFESEKLERAGFTLSSEVLKEDKVRFDLCREPSGQLWATVEVNPRTGVFAIR